MKIKILVLIPSIFLLSSCGSYFQKKDQGNPSIPSPDQKLDQGSGIAFEIVKKNIFEPSCIKCHQNYSFYDSVKQDLNSIVQNIETDRMPKNASPLTGEQKKLLAEWVTDGAKNTVATDDKPKPVEPVPDDKLVPSWTSLSRKIFFARCTTCHSPNGEAKFLDLSTRQKIYEASSRKFEGKVLLNFEKPEESYMLNVIQDPVEPMPPIKSKLQQLSKSEIEVLTEWIRLGLP